MRPTIDGDGFDVLSRIEPAAFEREAELVADPLRADGLVEPSSFQRGEQVGLMLSGQIC